jgi:hypothetical protein
MMLETNAPESVHTGLTRSLEIPGEYIFSFVNTTSGPVRPLRNLLPVYDLSVQLKLNGNLKSYKVLRTQGDVKVVSAKGKIDIKLKKLEDFFAVHFTMG